MVQLHSQAIFHTGAVRGESMNTQEIIQKAKDRFPCGYQYAGRLTKVERAEIKEVCSVQTMDVHMSGSHTYRIVYLEETKR